MNKILTTLLVSLLLLTACGDVSEEDVEEGGDITPIATAQRQTDPDDSKLLAVVQRQNDVALALHPHMIDIDGDDANRVFSPLSANTFMAQLYAATSGATRSEFEEKLLFPVQDDAYHEACNALSLGLDKRLDGDGVTFETANHGWYALDREVPQAFLDTLAINYGTQARRIDFASDPEGARETINHRIADDTHGLIEEFFGPADVTAQTKWLLVNSVYFNGEWLHAFDPNATYDDTFTNLDGGEAQTPMMHTSGYMQAASTETYDAVQLPYKSGGVAMVYVVPNDDFEAFEAGFDKDALGGVIDAMRPHEVNVAVPRLKLRTRVRFHDALRDATDLNVRTGEYENLGPNTTVDRIIHEAVIIVNEEGTEAAGVTGGGNNGAGPIDPPLEIDVDRPYLFFVMDVRTDLILFQGRVTSYPVASAE